MSSSPAVVCFGEIMMRLNTPSHQRFSQTNSYENYYGGAESNVSVLLARLGTPASFVTRLAQNDIGQAALEAIRHHGVDTTGIVRGPERMGLYFTETSNSVRPSRVIYDRKHSAFAAIQCGMIDWEKIFANARWFHWSGIAAAVSASAADVCLEALQEAKKAGVQISADLNYRSTLWDYGKHPSEVMPLLLSYCDVITSDIDAAEVYFGIAPEKNISKMKAMELCAHSIQQKLPSIKWQAMSYRDPSDDGALEYSGMLIGKEAIYHSTTHRFGDIVERIGSGDAFMGGLIHGMLNQFTPQQTIEFAAAAGALKHSIPGEFTILNSGEIENFLTQGNAKGKIIR